MELWRDVGYMQLERILDGFYSSRDSGIILPEDYFGIPSRWAELDLVSLSAWRYYHVGAGLMQAWRSPHPVD